MLNNAVVDDGVNSIQPLGGSGKTEEIAAEVAFMLPDENSLVTGSLVSMDDRYACQ